MLEKPENCTLAALGGAPLSRVPLPIARPRFPALDRISERLDKALARGEVTNNGPWLRAFEKALEDYVSAPTVACVNGQSAIMIMLRAAGVTGGEVIVPSYTFGATPHAVSWAGATPVFADVKADGSMTLDPEDAERRITEQTVAILAVDSYGIACDYEALAALGKRHGLKILYDSAPAFGSQLNGRRIGAYGDAQVFSFHATKAFSTMEGGCICSLDGALIARARTLRNFGQSAGADCDEPGINAKMTEVCALIGLEQLTNFDRVVEHRAQMADRMRTALLGIPGLEPASAPVGQLPVWLYLPVVIDPYTFGLDRDQVSHSLEQENILVRKYFEIPCHHMKAYRKHAQQSLPVTERIAYNVIALPVYNDMTLEECDLIVDAFRQIHRFADQLRATFVPESRG